MNRASVTKNLSKMVLVLSIMLILTAFSPQGCEDKRVTTSSTGESKLITNTTKTDSDGISSSASTNNTLKQAAAYMTEADELYNKGDYYKALRAYKRVINNDPANIKAKEKINLLEELIAEYETYYNLGIELWYQQNLSGALNEFEKAQAIYPNNEMVNDHMKTLKQILGLS